MATVTHLNKTPDDLYIGTHRLSVGDSVEIEHIDEEVMALYDALYISVSPDPGNAIVPLVDNSGGTASDIIAVTVGDVSVADAIASLAARINALEVALAASQDNVRDLRSAMHLHGN